MACDTIDINGQTWAARVHVDGFRKGNSLFGDGPWREVVYYLEDGSTTDEFIDALLGVATYIGLGGPITFPIPHRYPGNANLCALEAWSDPVGVRPDDAKLLRGMGDLVHVRYGVPKWDLDGTQTENAFGGQPEKFASDSTRGYTAEYSVPAGVFQDEDSNPYERSRPVKVPEIEYLRTKMYVPYFVDDVLAELAGKVNDAPLWGKERGTLLFEEWDDSPTFVDTRGNRVRAVQLRLRWRRYDWNAVPAPDPPYRWTILDDGSGTYAHEYADLSPLFTMGQ